jgi:DNA-3-methyladenine glycosylase I
MQKRCQWAESDPLYTAYHDQEWGVPLHDDQKLFEFLILEGAQAGLSWITILRKRQNYREAFDNFDAAKVAKYDQSKIDQLLTNPGIIRNQLKIRSAVTNAQAFLIVQQEFGSFDKYMWNFIDHQPIINQWETMGQIPAQTALSTAISKDMKARGFKFFGPTICYAHMQAVGMVNDHTTDCFRYRQLGGVQTSSYKY